MATTAEEEGARHTLYINNLNEKIKVEALKEELLKMCEPHGHVLAIVARDTLRTRGQAFVVFAEESAAAEAKAALEGKELHGKAMRIAFARTKSDPIAKLDGTLEERKARRNLLKERRIAEEKITKREEKRARREVEATISSAAATEPRNGPRMPPVMPGFVPPSGRPPMMPGVPIMPPTAAATVPVPQMPFSSGPAFAAPPPAAARGPLPARATTTLFLDNLPAEANEDTVKTLLESLGVKVQLKTCKMVPAKQGMVFLEYESKETALAALKKLNGHAMDSQHVLKAMFAAA